MNAIISSDRDEFGIAVALIAIALGAIVVLIAWRFVRAYIAESQSATVERLARAASAFPEQESVTAAHEVEAAAWLQGECKRLGIAMSMQRARAWVNAMRPNAAAVLSDEPALRAQSQPFIIKPLAGPAAGSMSTDERLGALACRAVQFLDQLKQRGPLTVRRGDAGAGVDVETDIAAAWLLTEVASCGLAVNTDEVEQALMAALNNHNHPSIPRLPFTDAANSS